MVTVVDYEGSDEEACPSVARVTEERDGPNDMCSEEINLKAHLLEMGYAGEEVSLAIERYGLDIPIDILIDLINAVRHSEVTSDEGLNGSLKKDCYETDHKKPFQNTKLKGSASFKGLSVEDEDINFRLPHHDRELVGFGVPDHPVD